MKMNTQQPKTSGAHTAQHAGAQHSNKVKILTNTIKQAKERNFGAEEEPKLFLLIGDIIHIKPPREYTDKLL